MLYLLDSSGKVLRIGLNLIRANYIGVILLSGGVVLISLELVTLIILSIVVLLMNWRFWELAPGGKKLFRLIRLGLMAHHIL